MTPRRAGPGPTPKARASLAPSEVAPSNRSKAGRVSVRGSSAETALSSTRQSRIDPSLRQDRASADEARFGVMPLILGAVVQPRGSRAVAVADREELEEVGPEVQDGHRVAVGPVQRPRG